MIDEDLELVLAYLSTMYLSPAVKQAYDRLRQRARHRAAEGHAELKAIRAELAAIKARNLSDAPYF